MEVRTYRANSIAEALRLVREQLGPDADVLGSHSVPAGGWLSFWRGKQEVEIQARRQSFESRIRRGKKKLDQGIDLCTIAAVCEEVETVAEENAPARIDFVASAPQWLDLQNQLVAAHVEPHLAAELIETAIQESAGDASEAAIRERIVQSVAGQLQIADPIVGTSGRLRTIAMVGPTGVGKTTTTAKLAAYFHLHQGLHVGLIAADTYRVAAVDQLRSYGEIMDLPVAVGSTPEEIRRALAGMRHLDLVLLDTAGCLPDDAEKAGALQGALEAAQPDDVYLVLSGTATVASLTKAVEHFSSVGATSMVLTKLDETPTTGHLLPLVRDSRLPLSYVTNGQNVPDDVMIPTPRWLAQQMLGFAN